MRVRIRKHSIPLDATSLGMLYSTDPAGGGGGGNHPAPPADTEDAGKEDAGAEKPAGDDEWQNKFAAQQKVNRDLEAKLNALRDGLKSALGVDDKKADIGDLVSGLKDQLDTLTHNNRVNETARRHGLMDKDDIALLGSTKDPDVMDKLGARLAKAAENVKPGKPGTPKPDPSQGKGGSGEVARPTSVAQVMADRQAAREKKTT